MAVKFQNKMDHWADYLIFVIFVLMSVGIGVYHAMTKGKQRTPEEFIMADRKMKLLPTTLSLLMSYQSAILILGSAAEVYSFGIDMMPMCMMGFTFAVFFTERLCVPWLYPLTLTSVNEYFEMRFGDREIRAFASIMGIISAILYMGIATCAPAIALETATGFPMMVSIPIMSAVCIIYTALGGMRAVIWTDVFQSVIMCLGIIAVLIKGMIDVGAKESFDTLLENDRGLNISFSFDPRVRQTFWTYSIGWTLQWLCIFGVQQASVQRFSSLTSLKSARISLLLTIPGLWAFNGLSFMVGIVVFSYFGLENCDPIRNGEINDPNEILPLFVRRLFVDIHGFSGLFLSTLFSGALSSVSSSLSGSAANAWDDILKPRMPHVSLYRAAVINKCLVIFIGLLSTAMAICAAFMAGPVTQIALGLFGACGGPLLGIFFLSGTWILKWVRSRGVLIAGITGLGCNLWLCVSAGFVKNKYEVKPPISMEGCFHNGTNITVNSSTEIDINPIDEFYKMSYLWYCLFGATITIVVGMVVSAIMNAAMPVPPKEINDKLFVSYRGMFKCTLDQWKPVTSKHHYKITEMDEIEPEVKWKR